MHSQQTKPCNSTGLRENGAELQKSSWVWRWGDLTLLDCKLDLGAASTRVFMQGVA